MMLRRFLATGALALLCACGSSSSTGTSSTTGEHSTSNSGGTGGSAGGTGGGSAGGSVGGGGEGGSQTTVGGDRPVEVYVPTGYSADKPAPLVILLHGYGVTGAIQELYFQLQPMAEKYGFLYAHPDGTVDSKGDQFWNATDACCDLDHTGVDDSAYLDSLIQEIKGRWSIDPKRVFFVGHSNGGFMTYRMACDHAEEIAAIVSLAGAMWEDITKCAAKEPVSVLQIHGTVDDEVDYNGNAFYPGAATTVADWVSIDQCNATADTSAAPIDVDESIAGSETTIAKYSGCLAGTGAALWTMAGSGHIPDLASDFNERVVGFLLAHPKP